MLTLLSEKSKQEKKKMLSFICGASTFPCCQTLYYFFYVPRATISLWNNPSLFYLLYWAVNCLSKHDNAISAWIIHPQKKTNPSLLAAHLTNETNSFPCRAGIQKGISGLFTWNINNTCHTVNYIQRTSNKVSARC